MSFNPVVTLSKIFSIVGNNPSDIQIKMDFEESFIASCTIFSISGLNLRISSSHNSILFMFSSLRVSIIPIMLFISFGINTYKIINSIKT